MAAHFGGQELFPGAWLGINFFLVFSGFIIVYLMMVEKNQTGTVNIIRFYRRRAKRLLPGLFVLLTVLGIWALLFAEDYVRRGMKGDILATLGYVMNWRLILTSDDYFVQFGTPSFLRHAWTLAVEEQFYLVAPFIVLAVFRWVPTRWKRVALMLGFATVSAVLAANVGVGDANAQAHAYYGTDTRAQAIFIGVAFAFLLGPDNQGRVPRRPRGPIIMALAWATVIFSVWCYTWVSPWDPWVFEKGGIFLISLALLPGFIACMDEQGNLIKKIFSNKFFVLLGLMTYGLYLWHWPIQIWLNLYLPDLTGWALFFVGSVLTIVVAFISFRFLEVPIILGGLDKFTGSKARSRRLITISMIVIISLAFVVGRVPSLSSQFASGNAPTLVPDQPVYEAGNEKINVAVYGDSTALYLATAFEPEFYPDMTVVPLAVPGCDLMRLPIDWSPTKKGDPLPECLESREKLTENLIKNATDVLVLNVGTLAPLSHVTPEGNLTILDPAYEKYVVAELDDIRASAEAAGVKQIQISTLPCRDTDLDYIRENPAAAELASTPDEINQVFTRWAETHAIPVLDLHYMLGCETGYVRKIRGVKLYSDQLHFSEYGAQMIWTWLAPAIRENFQAVTE
ncbi:MAG: acyltransferase [Actinomycetales bacterium]|nr:acyltransferase [Actinomycetales bacterium]